MHTAILTKYLKNVLNTKGAQACSADLHTGHKRLPQVSDAAERQLLPQQLLGARLGGLAFVTFIIYIEVTSLGVETPCVDVFLLQPIVKKY